MPTSRPKTPLVLTEDEQTQLRSWFHSRVLPRALVAGSLVLWSGQGQTISQIARRLHWAKATVGNWRQRFVQHRLAGLYDEVRPGRPLSIDDERVASLLKRTLSRQPTRGTHWTVRQAAEASGISNGCGSFRFFGPIGMRGSLRWVREPYDSPFFLTIFRVPRRWLG
jgi:putative transposase